MTCAYQNRLGHLPRAEFSFDGERVERVGMEEVRQVGFDSEYKVHMITFIDYMTALITCERFLEEDIDLVL